MRSDFRDRVSEECRLIYPADAFEKEGDMYPSTTGREEDDDGARGQARDDDWRGAEVVSVRRALEIDARRMNQDRKSVV